MHPIFYLLKGDYKALGFQFFYSLNSRVSVFSRAFRGWRLGIKLLRLAL